MLKPQGATETDDAGAGCCQFMCRSFWTNTYPMTTMSVIFQYVSGIFLSIIKTTATIVMLDRQKRDPNMGGKICARVSERVCGKWVVGKIELLVPEYE